MKLIPNRKAMIDELDRISNRFATGKATMADTFALARMAHDLRTPEEREIHLRNVEDDLDAEFPE